MIERKLKDRSNSLQVSPTADSRAIEKLRQQIQPHLDGQTGILNSLLDNKNYEKQQAAFVRKDNTNQQRALSLLNHIEREPPHSEKLKLLDQTGSEGLINVLFNVNNRRAAKYQASQQTVEFENMRE
jgi:hypothetical protein